MIKSLFYDSSHSHRYFDHNYISILLKYMILLMYGIKKIPLGDRYLSLKDHMNGNFLVMISHGKNVLRELMVRI